MRVQYVNDALNVNRGLPMECWWYWCHRISRGYGSAHINVACVRTLILDKTNTLFIFNTIASLYILPRTKLFITYILYTCNYSIQKYVCAAVYLVRYRYTIHMYTCRATATTDANAKTKNCNIEIESMTFLQNSVLWMMFALQISKSARCKWSRTQHAKRIAMVSKINQWINTGASERANAHHAHTYSHSKLFRYDTFMLIYMH